MVLWYSKQHDIDLGLKQGDRFWSTGESESTNGRKFKDSDFEKSDKVVF